MSKRLFVGNLPYSITDGQLSEMFAEFGEVSDAKIISDRMSGRSKGFGFVEMGDDAQADAAIAALNEKEMDGRNIVVNVARPQEDRGPSGGGGFNRGGPNRGGDRGGRRY